MSCYRSLDFSLISFLNHILYCFLPFEAEARLMFKNSVSSAKKTMFTSQISWLMLFKEVIAVYSENRTKAINTLCGQSAEFMNLKSRFLFVIFWLQV
jgi:hypothetical protein